jgi:hypothetical protein
MVKATREGLSLSVSLCDVTKVCHLCTFVDYININTLFSSNYMSQIFVLLSMGVFVMHVNVLC